MMGPQDQCGDTISCQNLVSEIADWLDANDELVASGTYNTQLVAALNTTFGVSYHICDYYRITSRCLSDTEQYVLFLGQLPDCSDSIPCDQLDLAIDSFFTIYSGTKDSANFTDSIVTYLTDAFSLPPNEIYVFCDFYLMLSACHTAAYVDSVLGEYGCDSLLNCVNLKNVVTAFNNSTSGAPNYTGYPDDITDELNTYFGLSLTFCDYYRDYRDCYGTWSVHSKMGNHPECEGGIPCTQLNFRLNQFALNHPGSPNLSYYQDSVTIYLNDQFDVNFTFCNWFDKYALCTTVSDAETKMGERGSCYLTPCVHYDSIYTELQEYLQSDTAAPGIANNMLAVTSWLNDSLGYDFSYDQYHRLLAAYAPQDSVDRWMGYNHDGVQGGHGVDYRDYELYLLVKAGESNDQLCNQTMVDIQADTIDPCIWQFMQIAINDAHLAYDKYIYLLRKQFINDYKTFCGNALELFEMTYTPAEHHFTLYYYDQAGNLVQTVPPEGVEADFTGTNHRIITSYRYNSLNEVIEQNTPDGGTTEYWYDRLGRIVVSQNAEQAIPRPVAQAGNFSRYSYTLYDGLGRIKEVGQLHQNTAMTSTISRDDVSLGNWITGAQRREEVTQTFYDEAIISAVATEFLQNEQRNLRNRVAHMTWEALWDDDDQTYDNATHYSYDIMGNAEEVVQEIGALRTVTREYRHILYEYDLVSGNTNKVWYEKGREDQFLHRYTYDEDNRLEEVYTSTDNLIWDKEANYQYYKHGPLARVELGQNRVQGLDYAYTLQGWIKGMNSGALDIDHDMGRDGDPNYTAYGRENVARDAVGYTLGYYEDDYKAIGRNLTGFDNFELATDNTDLGDASPSLFNGNIRHMVTAIQGLDVMGYAYEYDQLNRLLRMEAWDNTDIANWTWDNGGPRSDAFRTRYVYDANGNIDTLIRYDDQANLMDSLVYAYHDISGKRQHNKLLHVEDLVQGSSPTLDYEEPAAFNSADHTFEYDAIGNLIDDETESLQIKWNAYGKVDTIIDSDGNGQQITFRYDAGGQRVAKKVKEVSSGNYTETFYFRDASGNVMATYSFDGGDQYTLDELHLYGSSRLGIYKPLDLDVTSTTLGSSHSTSVSLYSFDLGEKQYELSNHLGNVLATISDRRDPVEESGSTGYIDYYDVALLTGQDYYPFGSNIESRSMGSQAYQYGFQGQEGDDEIKGIGNSINYDYRMYDPRIGRFFAIDPLSSDYPWQSPYVFAGNSPLMFVEKLGMSIDPVRKKFYLEMGRASMSAISERKVDEKANKFKALYMVAQRRMENGFNSSPPGNNPFNVKGTGDAGSVSYRTHEYVNGQRVNLQASFANYSSLDVGISAFIDVLESNFSDAYDALLSDSKTAQDYSKGLMNGRLGVYATDPEYEDKFTSMLQGVVSDFDEMLNSSLESLNESLKDVNGQISGLEKKEDKSLWDYGEILMLIVKVGVIEDGIKKTEANIKEFNEFKKNEGIE